MTNKILVLLSTYNGEKYLSEQLDSLLNQKNVSLNILIRDDDSKDNTKKIIKKYLNKYNNISFIEGNNLGYAKSFWTLLQMAKKYDYYAFCDQDDIWEENKLYSAIKLIENSCSIDTPILYTSRVISVDNEMNVISSDTFPCKKKLNVYESFQKSIVPGCVFVFNNNLAELLRKYDGYMESHDWATYIIASVFGKVIYDNNSYIKYRIHNNNVIGKKNKYTTFINKIIRFFKKSKRSRSKFAQDFFETYKEIIPPKLYQDIERLAYYRKKIKFKINIIFGNKFKGTIFKIYILINKV